MRKIVELWQQFDDFIRDNSGRLLLIVVLLGAWMALIFYSNHRGKEIKSPVVSEEKVVIITYKVNVITYDGHEYIVVNGGVCHSESCRFCKKGYGNY